MVADLNSARAIRKTARMEELAEKTGLTFDGGDDYRLFADDDYYIDVYAKSMDKAEYDEMEEKINNYSIVRDKYEVYAWNDCSGYEYWYNTGDLNYIKVTVSVSDANMSDEEIEQLKDDVQDAYDEFCYYHNIEDYIQNELS